LIKLLRSMLFVPGNNMRMLHKAASLKADAVILDMEDAVPMEDKETARLFVRDMVPELAEKRAGIYVRVNSWSTGLTQEDLEAAAQPGLDGIMLPKCETREDIEKLTRELEKLEAKRSLKKTPIVALIETPLGVVNAYSIASAPRVIAVAFGSVDFTREMGTTPSKEGTEVLYPRAHIAVAARAAGVDPIDTVWTDIMDVEGLIRDAKLARKLGYSGKLLIHPNQIDPVNKVFTPTPEEVEYAKLIVQEFEKAKAKGIGAISIKGKMIDTPFYKQALRTLQIHQAIEELEKHSTT